MLRSTNLGFFGIFGLLMLATVSAAADDDPLSENSLLFEEITSVYGASKYEQPLSEAPSQVTIVTAQEIQAFGYRSVSDVLRSVQGFYATNDRNYEYAGTRGFGRPGDYSTRILMTINGHRINDNLYSSALIGNDFPVDLDVVKQIEFIRGPGSSLYGASAFFAVINIVTHQGRDLKGLRAEAEVGSFGTAGPSLSYGNRFQNGLEVLASATRFELDGQDLYYPEFDDPATNNGMAKNVDDEQYENFFVNMRWRDLSFQASHASRDKTIPTGSYETVFNDPRNETRDRTRYLSLQYDHTMQNSMTLVTRLDYNRYAYDGDFVYDWADPGDPPYLVVNRDGALGEWWIAEAQLTARVGERHQLIGGLEFTGTLKQDQWNYDEEVYLDDSRENDNWGLFLQDEFRVGERVTVNLGARHDHYDTFGGTTNPRLAVIYHPGSDTTMKFLYGTAFRAPNAYELYYHDGFSFQKPALDLKPESITTFEWAVEQRLGDHLRGTASLYNYTIDDLIDQLLDPADDLLVFRNISEVEARGVEVELEGKWAKTLDGRISYALQETESRESGEQLTNSPKHTAKLALFAPIVRGKLNVGAELQYTGTRLDLDRTSQPSFLVTNVTLAARRIYEGLGVSLSVYNLFDEEYGDVASDELEQAIVVQDGRSLRLRLSYEF